MASRALPSCGLRQALLAILCAVPGGAVAERPAPDLVRDEGRSALRVYSTRDGLPQNTIQAMAFDRAGRLWVGTQAGPAWFDGVAWRQPVLPPGTRKGFVLALTTAPGGGLWIGLEDAGLLQFDGTRWLSHRAGTDGLPSDRVQALLVPRDQPETVWVATDQGVAHFAAGRFRAFTPANSGLPHANVTSLAESGEEGRRSLWAGTHEGLGRLVDGQWTRFGSTDDLPNAHVQSLLADGPDELWVGTASGLARWRQGAWRRFDSASTGVPALQREVQSLLVQQASYDAGRRLWVGTNAGLAVCDEDDTCRLYADAASGLPSAIVRSMATSVSASGDPVLWIGTYEGLARSVQGLWTQLVPSHSGLPDRAVTGIVEADGALWFSTWGNGLARTRGGRWAYFRRSGGHLADDSVVALAPARGAGGGVWAATLRNGLVRVADGHARFYDTRNSALPSDRVQTLLSTTSGLWVGTSAGLAWVDEDGLARVSGPDGDPLSVDALHERRTGAGSELWVGTRGAGLWRRAAGQWTAFTQRDSVLPSNYVLAVVDAPGPRPGLWVGTKRGLLRFDPADRNTGLRFDAESVPALHDEVVAALASDGQGRIYLNTNQGVARLTSRVPGPTTTSDFTLEHFTSADGLPHEEANRGALYRDGSGRIWTGTMRGVAVLEPGRALSPRPASLQIERLIDSGREVALAPDLTLPAGRHSLRFEVALLSFVRSQENRYRTQLLGYEDEPREWSPLAYREYTNVPPGTYTFEVSARDFVGSEVGPQRLSFTVLTPVWRRPWALALYTVCAVLGTWMLLWTRERAHRERARELEQRVAERTRELAEANGRLRELDAAKAEFGATLVHDLRSPLSVVTGALQLFEDEGRSPGLKAEFGEIARRSLGRVQALLEDMLLNYRAEAGRLELTLVPTDVGELVKAAFDEAKVAGAPKGIQFSWVAPGPLPAIAADPPSLTRAFANLFGNAVKFTPRGGLVSASARVTDGTGVDSGRRFVLVEVRDSGPGIADAELPFVFEPYRQGSAGGLGAGVGLGLAITRQIVVAHGGQVLVRSQPGVGSTFLVHLPLPT
ncbi:MAG: ATP-binding protein [Vicinamibacteria bacterium]|nr:ATP-binding protein [Vicinamibacteria bacterium]